MKRESAAQPLPRHFAARRDSLNKLIASLREGGDLTMDARLEAARILEEVRDGYDPRTYYAIKPKPGARPSARGDQRFIVLYFLKLSELHPYKPMKSHHDIVSKAAGISQSWLRSLIKAHRDDCARVLAASPAFTLTWLRETVERIANAPS